MVNLPGAIGINNLGAFDSEYWNFLDFGLLSFIGCDDDRRVCPLRDDDDPRPLGVLLWCLGKQRCHFRYRRCGAPMRFSPSLDLVLVREDVVAVR